MKIKRRKRFVLANKPVYARERHKKGMQGHRSLDHNSGTKIGHHGRISNELDGVAKPLLAVKEDCLAGYIAVAKATKAV
jgi:hypothetical protein